MNDRFKFRVWDKNRKFYPIPTDFLIDCDGNLWEQCTPIDNSDNHLIIEQCTGLKDKNGKLIYEGDVVSDMGIEAVVGWYSDRYMIEYDDGSIGELAIAAEALEIIGNIHEIEVVDEK